ncbi:hypothetical protein FACS1894139_13170 [Planctomycetales bacterium]|nr:hypothetical protein FACS1894107_05060 [Planctomycetales bacterium]GHS99901.1 hypothetical protein FACS1894108_10790 [Planctomycetales bacterium]GHT06699.1 hypothetical protein FACS1894139_13170 [Planctomycetales bacterium]
MPPTIEKEYTEADITPPIIRRVNPVEQRTFDAEIGRINDKLDGLQQQLRQQGEYLCASDNELRRQHEKFAATVEERFDRVETKIAVQGVELRQEIKEVRQELRQEIKDGRQETHALRQEIKGMFARQTQLLALVAGVVGVLLAALRFVDQATIDALWGK